ncbi:MAG: PLDc_N domain-containing protein [Verrucomicrobia bacterium]|nr:PLDc_N domain-containing protein [Verrucomicrobiota bacterium]MBT7067111.1 PLDc_N domain-containing protein [Verrucomicrobiota bacterium]MBT7699245.1 PLDc_N domain-containing protein [Verrucomicrobiota bacterium]
MMMMLPLLVMAVGVAATIFWIWMLVDCATKEPAEGNDKLTWVLIIVLTHWIGALIYLLVRRPKRIEEFGA